MFYVSLIKAIPNTLSQPSGIAALASLGFHGALGFILPVLPIDSKPEEASPRTVGLVQLTPAEQSRLPPGAIPQITLPPFATQQSVLPPLPSAQYSRLTIPPTSTAPINVNKYPAVFSLSQNPVPPKSRTAQRRQQLSFNPGSSFGKVSTSVGIPVSAEKISVSNNFSVSQPRQTVRTQEIARLSDVLDGLTPAKVVPRDLQTVPVNQTPDISFNQENQNPTATQPSTTPSETPPPATPSEPQQTATVNSTPNQSVTPTQGKLPEAGKLALLQRREELRQGNSRTPNYSPSAGTQQTTAQINNWEQWQTTLQQENPNGKTTGTIRRNPSTCQKELDGSVAVVGVGVNPEGKIVSGPTFLDSPSAAGLQAANNYVKEYNFQATSKPTNYQFRLQFKYDASNCTEATPRKPAPETEATPRKPAPTSQWRSKLAPESQPTPKTPETEATNKPAPTSQWRSKLVPESQPTPKTPETEQNPQ